MEVLLNINNFGHEPFRSVLQEVLRPDMRVLIMPLSFHEAWIRGSRDFYRHYGYGGDEFRDIAKEFYAYGIKPKNIRVLNPFRDSREAACRKLERADVLFYTGGYPEKILYRLDSLGIREEAAHFPGIVMGTSAGAMVQFDHYHVTPEEPEADYEYHDGLGRLSGFDIEVHYDGTFDQLSCMLIALKQTGLPIYAMPNSGGLLCCDDALIPMGDTFLVTEEDLDDLQEAIDAMEEEAEQTEQMEQS